MFKNLPDLLRLCLFLLLVGGFSPLIAQNYSGHNWYFGNSTQAIRFNRTDNTASLINTKGI
ncbi:MAG: hypothetical protein ACOYXT_14970, partial [Bacteroidota bacterium]